MDTDKLLARIAELEEENERLRSVPQPQFPKIDSHFSLDEYKRYGRQMIVAEFGSLPSQIKLKNSSILVVGAGGLGCPALMYLAAAGIGRIGIIDDDIVDTSNLHRQVLHTTETVGMLKCESAKRYLNKLNPHVDIHTYGVRLDNSNAFGIVEGYDVVLDCTDTPATRYLINDVSVISGKTIVSGSGLKTEGQLSVLNFNNVGPCYRCFYPKPPSPDSVTSCSDGGVIGPVIGLLGVTMAVETIKVLTYYTNETFKPFLSMYSGYPHQQLRMFKMRNRKNDCAACSSVASITREMVESGQIDYAAFCGSVSPNNLDSSYRISVHQYKSSPTVLVDVRPKEQYQITKLPNSINVPWEQFKKCDNIDEFLPQHFDKETPISVICRYGNDSQLATKRMVEEFGFKHARDIIGGINKWSDEIDETIPKY